MIDTRPAAAGGVAGEGSASPAHPLTGMHLWPPNSRTVAVQLRAARCAVCVGCAAEQTAAMFGQALDVLDFARRQDHHAFTHTV